MSISEAIESVLRTYSISAQEINTGFCHDFAHKVIALVPGSSAIWGCDVEAKLDDLGCHKHILFEGRIYDAEAPTGVDHAIELPFYQRCIRNREDRKRGILATS
jgi:hypothetical protein